MRQHFTSGLVEQKQRALFDNIFDNGKYICFYQCNQILYYCSQKLIIYSFLCCIFFLSHFNMVNSSRLFVGCRVTGCFGPFIENESSNSKKRRTRERVTGTVIRAVDKHKWDVIFDFDGKLKKGISSRSLMIAPGEAGIPLTNVNVEEDDSNGKEAEVRIWINLNIILFFCTNYVVILFSIFILLHRILRTPMPVMGFLIILVQY